MLWSKMVSKGISFMVDQLGKDGKESPRCHTKIQNLSENCTRFARPAQDAKIRLNSQKTLKKVNIFILFGGTDNYFFTVGVSVQ